jgi:plastocyanin
MGLNYSHWFLQLSLSAVLQEIGLAKRKRSTMRKIFVIVVSVLVLALTACSSPKVTLNVTANDQSYDSSTYTVPAGAEVTLNLTNTGAAAHVFDILKLGEHVTPPYQSADKDKILWELVAKAGETQSGTFTAPTEPGEYDIICRVPGHIQLGMAATLIVEE